MEKLLYIVKKTSVDENIPCVDKNITLNYESLEDDESHYVNMQGLVIDKIRSMTDHNDDIKYFFETVFDVALLQEMELHTFITLVEEWNKIKYQQRYVSNRLELLSILNIVSIPLLIKKNYLIENRRIPMINGDEVLISFEEYQLILEIGVEWINYLHKQRP